MSLASVYRRNEPEIIATVALTLWLISWPLRTSKAASDESI
jgi:hypothetical protein